MNKKTLKISQHTVAKKGKLYTRRLIKLCHSTLASLPDLAPPLVFMARDQLTVPGSNPVIYVPVIVLVFDMTGSVITHQ